MNVNTNFNSQTEHGLVVITLIIDWNNTKIGVLGKNFSLEGVW